MLTSLLPLPYPIKDKIHAGARRFIHTGIRIIKSRTLSVPFARSSFWRSGSGIDAQRTCHILSPIRVRLIHERTGDAEHGGA